MNETEEKKEARSSTPLSKPTPTKTPKLPKWIHSVFVLFVISIVAVVIRSAFKGDSSATKDPYAHILHENHYVLHMHDAKKFEILALTHKVTRQDNFVTMVNKGLDASGVGGLRVSALGAIPYTHTLRFDLNTLRGTWSCEYAHTRPLERGNIILLPNDMGGYDVTATVTKDGVEVYHGEGTLAPTL